MTADEAIRQALSELGKLKAAAVQHKDAIIKIQEAVDTIVGDLKTLSTRLASVEAEVFPENDGEEREDEG